MITANILSASLVAQAICSLCSIAQDSFNDHHGSVLETNLASRPYSSCAPYRIRPIELKPGEWYVKGSLYSQEIHDGRVHDPVEPGVRKVGASLRVILMPYSFSRPVHDMFPKLASCPNAGPSLTGQSFRTNSLKASSPSLFSSSSRLLSQ